MYIGGLGGENVVNPNREIVFRVCVCVCVACVRACEAVRRAESRQKRGPMALRAASQNRGRNPSIRVTRMGPKKGPKVGPRVPPSPPKSSYHACVALWIVTVVLWS